MRTHMLMGLRHSATVLQYYSTLHYTLHYTILHHTTLHHTPHYTTMHYTVLHVTLHHTTPHNSTTLQMSNTEGTHATPHPLKQHNTTDLIRLEWIYNTVFDWQEPFWLDQCDTQLHVKCYHGVFNPEIARGVNLHPFLCTAAAI